MKKKELYFLLAEGEGYNLEFKESFSDSISKDICAFANSNGGKILLGVSDTGLVRGIAVTNRLKSQIQDIARNMDPKFEVFLYELGNVFVAEVPEGTNKPYSVGGKFYMRQGANSQQMTREEIRLFFQKEGLLLFDEKPDYSFDIKKDLSHGAYKNFIEKAGLRNILSMPNVLGNLELLKGEHMKNAGVLLFCRKVTRFHLSATITCALFQGTEKVKILDSREFDSDLYSNYKNAMDYITTKLNTEYIINTSGPRVEKLELPEEALKEALLNAIALRDYFSNANIQVYIFNDRVEIVNPGGLVAGMKVSDLGKKSASRNKLLFGLMQRMDLVEKIGSGIKRIRDAMKEYKLKQPFFEVDDNWFTVVFNRPDLQKESWEVRMGLRKPAGELGKVKRDVSENVSENVSEKRLKQIADYIQNDIHITIPRLAMLLNVTERTIHRGIDKLRLAKKLRRIGPDKGRHWEVVGR